MIADQYRNRPTILRLPKMNTASRRPDRPQNQNESSVPSRYRTRLSANAREEEHRAPVERAVMLTEWVDFVPGGSFPGLSKGQIAKAR